MGKPPNRSEIIIGLACTTGTNIKLVKETLKETLALFGYNDSHGDIKEIKVSAEILDPLLSEEEKDKTGYERTLALMEKGNELREEYNNYIKEKSRDDHIDDYSVIALGVADIIINNRTEQKMSQIRKSSLEIDKVLIDFENDFRKNAENNTERLKNFSNTNKFLSALEEQECNSLKYIQSIRDMLKKDVESKQMSNTVFIIDSLKHPHEVIKLRNLYPSSFYLLAINEKEENRINYLTIMKENIGGNNAKELIKKDYSESSKYGQRTRDVFEIADFYISMDLKMHENYSSKLEYDNTKNSKDIKTFKKKKIQPQIKRILDLLFGAPYITPTFDEYAMFMAYSAGLTSADLSRQVGAVIANQNDSIIATGSNEVAKFNGGQYWLEVREEVEIIRNKNENYKFEYYEEDGGRDYKNGYDPNKKEHERIVDEIVDEIEWEDRTDETTNITTSKTEQKKIFTDFLLEKSAIGDLTEFGRIVHAEMSAITSCARNGISLQGATLYCSTFPCHNCGKHIVSSGIKRVVYVEPYPKSKTFNLFPDSISSNNQYDDKVIFEPFYGVAPRQFFDMFSLNLSSGKPIMRKNKDSNTIVKWFEAESELRKSASTISYLERELTEGSKYNEFIKVLQKT